MRTRAPKRDWTETFSHAEMLKVTGLSADTVLTWHKRQYTLESRTDSAKQGRGNRRRYSTLSVLHLCLLKEVSRLGMELVEASAISACVLKMVRSIGDWIEFYTEEELMHPPDYCYLAVWDDPSGKQHGIELPRITDASGLERPLLHSIEIIGGIGQPRPDVASWARSKNVTSVRLIDLVGLVVSATGRMAAILIPRYEKAKQK